MDAKKITLIVLLLILVAFLVLAGQSCSGDSVEEGLADLDTWKARIATLKESSWLAPEPLCADTIETQQAACRLDDSMNLNRGMKCQYTISGRAADQRRGSLEFRGSRADRLVVTSGNPSLVKAVPKKTKRGDKTDHVLLIAESRDEDGESTSLTIECQTPNQGNTCQLRYVVKKPEGC